MAEAVRALVVATALGSLLGLGLGAAVAGPVRDSADKTAPSKAAPGGDGMQIAGLMGQLDAPLCEKVLREAAPAVKKCYEEASSRLFYLGGRLEAKLIVGAGGEPRSIALTTSTVGSYEVERCILTALGKLRFPPPKGGDGEMTYPVEFSAKSPVGSFTEAQVIDKLGAAKLKTCQAKAKKPRPGEKHAGVGDIRATLYVGPGGQVTTVGFAADEPIDDAVAKCLQSKIQATRLEDPLGKMVKVSVDLGAAAK